MSLTRKTKDLVENHNLTTKNDVYFSILMGLINDKIYTISTQTHDWKDIFEEMDHCLVAGRSISPDQIAQTAKKYDKTVPSHQDKQSYCRLYTVGNGFIIITNASSVLKSTNFYVKYQRYFDTQLSDFYNTLDNQTQNLFLFIIYNCINSQYFINIIQETHKSSNAYLVRVISEFSSIQNQYPVILNAAHGIYSLNNAIRQVRHMFTVLCGCGLSIISFMEKIDENFQKIEKQTYNNVLDIFDFIIKQIENKEGKIDLSAELIVSANQSQSIEMQYQNPSQQGQVGNIFHFGYPTANTASCQPNAKLTDFLTDPVLKQDPSQLDEFVEDALKKETESTSDIRHIALLNIYRLSGKNAESIKDKTFQKWFLAIWNEPQFKFASSFLLSADEKIKGIFANGIPVPTSELILVEQQEYIRTMGKNPVWLKNLVVDELDKCTDSQIIDFIEKIHSEGIITVTQRSLCTKISYLKKVLEILEGDNLLKLLEILNNNLNKFGFSYEKMPMTPELVKNKIDAQRVETLQINRTKSETNTSVAKTTISDVIEGAGLRKSKNVLMEAVDSLGCETLEDVLELCVDKMNPVDALVDILIKTGVVKLLPAQKFAKAVEKYRNS